MRLVIADEGAWASDSPVDSVLIKAISRARGWFDDLSAGRASSLLEIAKAEAISDRYIGQLMPLAFLAPEVVAQIIAGSQPGSLTTETLRREPDLPVSWVDQLSLLRLR